MSIASNLTGSLVVDGCYDLKCGDVIGLVGVRNGVAVVAKKPLSRRFIARAWWEIRVWWFTVRYRGIAPPTAQWEGTLTVSDGTGVLQWPRKAKSTLSPQYEGAARRLREGKPDGSPWTSEDHWINAGLMNPDGTWTDEATWPI